MKHLRAFENFEEDIFSHEEYGEDTSCPDCEGLGTFDCGTECDRCEGTGSVYRPEDIPPMLENIEETLPEDKPVDNIESIVYGSGDWEEELENIEL